MNDNTKQAFADHTRRVWDKEGWLGPMADDHTWTLGDWTVEEETACSYTVIHPDGSMMFNFPTLFDAQSFIEQEM